MHTVLCRNPRNQKKNKLSQEELEREKKEKVSLLVVGV